MSASPPPPRYTERVPNGLWSNPSNPADPAPIAPDDLAAHALLRLTLAKGVGPRTTVRLLRAFGSVEAACRASPADLARLEGLGETKARRIAEALRDSAELVEPELARAVERGVRLLALGHPGYPALLAEIDPPPPLLYVRGSLDADGADQYPVAIVGSRRCTAYGIEQAERFAMQLAEAGLTIVSGGARGIDAAAHRGALRVRGRSIAVLGCGLDRCYPPEHGDLYDQLARQGAVVSELPMTTPPNAENFPARNRIISGLSLGVIVIEAGRKSGALITARQAVEDQGREVMGVPGRVDSDASLGTHDLLKQGGAHLVTSPADVLEILENAARHAHQGTHAARYADPSRPVPETPPPRAGAIEAGPREAGPREASLREAGLSDEQRSILAALAEGERTPDELAQGVGLDPGRLRALLTVLEVRGLIVRRGLRLARKPT
ncbi:MAG: DNA-protecting protein DprA [Phycisphaerales bacterium]|nr:MAG: DNA-protecting protein DprA [Phycisphaerales bacterium]